MLPWILLERVRAPDGTELVLSRRGDEFSIRAGGHELMSSRAHGSEERLAELGTLALGPAHAPRVLVAGLGCGYTLAAALARLPAAARVEVVELSGHVVEWNRGVLGELTGHPLRDPRVTVREADLVDVLGGASDAHDLILLDVDNGPAALTQSRNAWLYGATGIARMRAALRARGVLVVWSAGPDSGYVARLRKQGFAVTEHAARAHGSRTGKRHVIWLAQRGERSATSSPPVRREKL